MHDQDTTGSGDLSHVSTAALTAELCRREEAARNAAWEAIERDHPCPECGASPVSLKRELVEEFRFAPEDDEGRPMIYAPYEMGATKGARYETTVTCSAGHECTRDSVEWFDRPISGPPMLPRR